MRESDFLECNFTLPNFIDSAVSNYKTFKAHPDWMRLNGLVCFCGEQGSGKTLSAVRYLFNVCQRYPDAVVCTNLDLSDLGIVNHVEPYTSVQQLLDLNNDRYGVIYLLDEIHLEFNSLESKSIDSNIFELVSQQRKQAKHIIGTSQVFGRLAKPFREQFKYAILCKKIIGSLFMQQVFRAQNVSYEDDIKTELVHQCNKFYIASPEMFASYDTYSVIKRVRKEWKR